MIRVAAADTIFSELGPCRLDALFLSTMIEDARDPC